MDEQSNVTRDGITVQVGQVWRDCDKRMYSGNRHCKVIGVIDGKATMVACRPDGSDFSNEMRTTVRVRRMYRHSTGWELVTP